MNRSRKKVTQGKIFYRKSFSDFCEARSRTMMFSTLFVLFAAVVAANADERGECKFQAWKTCDVTKSPDEIPDTMEELKRGCIVVQEMAKCVAEEFEKCDVEGFDEEYARVVRRLAQFLETNCDEESSLYQALSRNYECIQTTAKSMRRHQCFWLEQDFEEVQNLEKKADIRLSETAERCKNGLYKITCTAHIIGKRCGQEAKEVVTEIMRNTEWDFRNCNEESIIGELEPLREVYEAISPDEPEAEDNILEELSEALDK